MGLPGVVTSLLCSFTSIRFSEPLPFVQRIQTPGGGGGGHSDFSSTGVCPSNNYEWESKELTTRVKYRVLGTTIKLSGRVKNGV